MNLDTRDWQGFKIEDLFSHFERGKANQTKLEEGSEVFYVGAKRDDNGVMLHCAYDENLISKGNCIVFISNGQGSVGYANYMNIDFIASTDLILGYADWLNESIGLFLSTVFSLERPKYSFGRKWGRYLKTTVVDLPIQRDSYGCPVIDASNRFSSKGYIPDWKYMEGFIHALDCRPLSTKNSVCSTRNLDFQEDRWKWFALGGSEGLFDIRKGKRLTSNDQTEGETPYVGAISSNNGIANYIGQAPIHDGNTISLSYDGSIGEAFYQPDPYWASDAVNALYLRSEYGVLNPATGLFICAVLRQEKYRYSYGRKWTIERMNDTKVQLPVTPEGMPDWKFMEQYILNLPYGDRIPDKTFEAVKG